MIRPFAEGVTEAGATLAPAAASRPASFGGRFRSFVERSPLPLLLLGAVLLVCTVGALQRWLLHRPPVDAMAASTARDLIAALLWIPLGAAAVALARRVPLRRGARLRSVLLHLVAGAAATAMLNLVWALIIAPIGLWPDPALGFTTLVARYAVGFLHIDVPIWLLIAAVASAWNTPATTDEPEDADGQPHDRIAIRGNGLTTFVEIDRIDWIEAAGDYARLHVAGKSYLLGERMHALEARLADRFVRVHRSAIVNVSRVRDVRPRAAGDATLVLTDDTCVPLSRRRRAAVLARLSARSES